RFADRREPVDLVAEGAGSGSDGVGPALRAVGVGARVARGDGPSGGNSRPLRGRRGAAPMGGWRRVRGTEGFRGCAGLADRVTRGGSGGRSACAGGGLICLMYSRGLFFWQNRRAREVLRHGSGFADDVSRRWACGGSTRLLEPVKKEV